MPTKSNLLIVDDEEPLRVILESELTESEEFVVDTAADGGEAINRIQAKVYDVILLDVRMPRVSGISYQSQIPLLARVSSTKAPFSNERTPPP